MLATVKFIKIPFTSATISHTMLAPSASHLRKFRYTTTTNNCRFVGPTRNKLLTRCDEKQFFHTNHSLTDSTKLSLKEQGDTPLTFTGPPQSGTGLTNIAELKLGENGKMVYVTWNNGRTSTFSAEWIRQHDRSRASYNADTNQRQANRALITADPTICDIHIEKNSVYFTTKEDGFSGFVPAELLAEVEWLRRESRRDDRCKATRAEKLAVFELPFDFSNKDESKSHSSNANQNQLQTVLEFQSRVCDAIIRDGACIVRTSSTHLGYVSEFTEKALGLNVWQSVYGKTSQVRVEPKPDNLAYTSAALYLHQDLPYYESPPGLQLLHCLQNSVPGGKLMLVDSTFVAEQMRSQYPDKFAVLTRVPVLYQKVYGKINVSTSSGGGQNPVITDYAAHLRRYQPIIVTNRRGDVVDVRFNVITDGPMIMPIEDEKPFLDAYRTFYNMLASNEWQLQWRYEPGDVVIMNNRRMMHGRTEFDSARGMRHLETCYVNIDEFRSKAICLHKTGIFATSDELEAERFMEPRVGNGDWL